MNTHPDRTSGHMGSLSCDIRSFALSEIKRRGLDVSNLHHGPMIILPEIICKYSYIMLANESITQNFPRK